MPTRHESRRIVIAGASSLLGTELKSLLEESRFAACDFRLVDEEAAAGQWTEAGGEPAVIQPVESDSFAKAWVVFFAGSPAFTKRNLELAKESGARVIDLSGEVAGQPGAQVWMPKMPVNSGPELRKDGQIFGVPSAAAEMISRLAFLVHDRNRARLFATVFQPVSAAGKRGIEELEAQTSELLSFQPTGQSVFDAQVAFNILSRFGPQSSSNLEAALEVLRKEVRAALSGDVPKPAIQLLHAPVFYGASVLASVATDDVLFDQELERRCADAGFTVTPADRPPNNVSVAGESTPHLAPPQADAPGTDVWWFWAVADNVRVPATNAVKLAESLLE